MSKTPRPYQRRSIDACIPALKGHGRVCLVLPTGAGKTFTAQRIAATYDNPLYLVHRTELADQAPGRAVTVQSLLNGTRPDADLLVADECHHLGGSADQWRAVAEDYPVILGLTATPQRHDGAPLDLFRHLVVGAQYSELIRDGYLLEPRVVRPAEELEGLAQKPAEAWRKLAGDRCGLAFFSRVELAENFCRELPGRAAVVHGKMDKDARRDTLDAFKRGDLHILANCQVLTEGWDHPPAEVCMVARGCQHAGAWLQMVGRVLRPSPGKAKPLVIDLPGVSHRLGLPTEDRDYSLTGSPIRRLDAEAIQQCRECGAVYAPAPYCPECGCVPPPVMPRVRVWGVPMDEVGKEISAADRGKLKWKDRMMQDDEARYSWLLKKCKHSGHAAAMHRSMFGAPLPRDWWGRLARDGKRRKR